MNSREIDSIAFTSGKTVINTVSLFKKYFGEIKVSKTLLLSPNSEFMEQSKSIKEKDVLKFYRTYSYDTNPKKITGEIEKITKYRERKKDLELAKKFVRKLL